MSGTNARGRISFLVILQCWRCAKKMPCIALVEKGFVVPEYDTVNWWETANGTVYCHNCIHHVNHAGPTAQVDVPINA